MNLPNREIANGEEKIKWLIIIAKKEFDLKNEIGAQPSFTEQHGDIVILQYNDITQKIDKLACSLQTAMTMRLPSQRKILMLIDCKGILWRNQTNKITNIEEGNL